MFRPVLEWKEDGKPVAEYEKYGYLNMIEDSTALLRALYEWQAELIRKEQRRERK